MTYKRSHTACIRPVLGRSGPRQTFDIKAICSIFSISIKLLRKHRRLGS